MKQVRAALAPEEPDYSFLRELGSDALPHLAALVRKNDRYLAPKAAAAAGHIDEIRGRRVVRIAAESGAPDVRVAAAVVAPRLTPEGASEILGVLLKDHDVGVRKVAIRSVSPELVPDVRSQLESIAEGDPVPLLRELAKHAIDQGP